MELAAKHHLLAGSTYQVHGRYGGDGIYAPSESQPVNLTVTPEDSHVQITFAYTVVVDRAATLGQPHFQMVECYVRKKCDISGYGQGINASFASFDGHQQPGP